MRIATGTGYPGQDPMPERRQTRAGDYPHQNLNLAQRAALDRLFAPRVQFARYWANVTMTDPDAKGLMFWTRRRRTWALYVRGYPVIQLAGKVKE